MRAFGWMTVALLWGCDDGNDDTTPPPDDGDADTDTDTDADTDDTDDTDDDTDDTDDTDSDTDDSDTDDTDDTDTDTDTDTDDDTDLPVLWADVEPIFAAECVGCHWPNGNSGGFTFNGPEDVVNEPSIDEPGMDRIEPGLPDESYLWHKLQGTQGTVQTVAPPNGAQMPLMGSVTATDLDLIEEWILDGALQ